MGIPGLTRRLEPHATRYQPEHLAGYHAIIDGPSLAYHAHSLARLEIGDEPRVPSYADINRLAFRWLVALEALNINVLAILFDGALPSTKTEERVSRQDQNNQRVKLLRSCYAASACPVPISLGPVSYSFLAPVLRESLSSGRFAHATWVVPGEADEWCASCAYATPRSIVFSSDSDLLLYEYHAETKIMFFHDIELLAEQEFKGYAPAHIAQSLGLTTLVPFAYYLMQDKHLLFNSLVERAKNVDMKSKDYIDFSRRYRSGTCEPDILPQNEVPRILERLAMIPQHLDVRVSELVDQLQNNMSSPAVYLPLLVEDPNTPSAWNLGQETIREYLRKAQTITTQHLTLLHAPSTLVSSITNLDTVLRTSLSILRTHQTPFDLSFPLLAVSTFLLPCLPSPPKISQVIRILHADYDKTWAFIHLTARYHAILYSLRILKQSLSLALSLTPTDSPHRTQLSSVHEVLADMPPMDELFLVPGQTKVVSGNEERLRRLLPEMYRECGVEVPSEVDKKKSKKKAREADRKERRKREKEGGGKGGAMEGKTWNVFDVLGGG